MHTRFPADDRWVTLWSKLNSEQRHDLAAGLNTSYNCLRHYSNGSKRMSPPRARKAADVLNAMGYKRVTKAWFRPDLW